MGPSQARVTVPKTAELSSPENKQQKNPPVQHELYIFQDCFVPSLSCLHTGGGRDIKPWELSARYCFWALSS